MSFVILPLSLLCGLVLCAAAVAIFASYRAHRLLAEIDAREKRAQGQTLVQSQDFGKLRETIDALASQIRELQSQPPVPALAGAPKSGLNLSKRSQALRMHRRGEAPGQIAASLDMPRQEVELLLKVHSIVIQNI